jgi:hypothetical protein
MFHVKRMAAGNLTRANPMKSCVGVYSRPPEGASPSENQCTVQPLWLGRGQPWVAAGNEPAVIVGDAGTLIDLPRRPRLQQRFRCHRRAAFPRPLASRQDLVVAPDPPMCRAQQPQPHDRTARGAVAGLRQISGDGSRFRWGHRAHTAKAIGVRGRASTCKKPRRGRPSGLLVLASLGQGPIRELAVDFGRLSPGPTGYCARSCRIAPAMSSRSRI